MTVARNVLPEDCPTLMTKDFSIIIPAKNEEANIGRCLDSIAKLDWDKRRYQVVVVDNGSTDRTVEIARGKSATVYVLPVATIACLRNHGALNSEGTILAFLDADCTVARSWLQAASVYLDELSDVVAFGSPVVVPDGGTWVQRAWFNVRGKPGKVLDVVWLESANLFVRRSAFLAVNGFDESLVTCEDYDLTQRLRAHGRLVSDYRVMAVHYREPATVREFLMKEMWRSKSNYKGILSRKVERSELPSLLLPVVYLVWLVLCLCFVPLYLIGGSLGNVLAFLSLILLLQVPLGVLSIKMNKCGDISTVLQLFILLNVYFFARGVAVLRRS